SLAMMIEDELKVTLPKVNLVFNIKPLFDKLSNVLAPQIAYASGVSGEAPTFLVTEPQRRFVFEIIHRRRQSPYIVYVRIVELAHELENLLCRITVEYSGREFKSDLTELQQDRSIPLGEDKQFDGHSITNVRIEIE